MPPRRITAVGATILARRMNQFNPTRVTDMPIAASALLLRGQLRRRRRDRTGTAMVAMPEVGTVTAAAIMVRAILRQLRRW